VQRQRIVQAMQFFGRRRNPINHGTSPNTPPHR
jgi:hypothetical protein